MAAWTVVTPLDVPESATSQKMPHTTKPIAKLCTAEVRRPPIPTPSLFLRRHTALACQLGTIPAVQARDPAPG